MMTGEAVAYVIDVEFMWGYQATVAGLTKSPPPYTYPPPTTVLGAVAEAIARSEGLGESSLPLIMNALTKDLMAVALKPLNCVPIKYQDIGRVIAVRESGGVRYPNAEDPQGSFDAPARGRTVLAPLPSGGGDQPRDAPRIEWVFVWRRNPAVRMLTHPQGLPLSDSHLWRVHRVGSKESLASVVRVLRRGVKALPSSAGGMTRYSFPLKAVSQYELLSGKWVVESYADPFKPYGEGESPALRYLRGDVIPFASPILTAVGEEPVARVTPSSEGVLLEVEGVGVVVGVIKG